MLYTRRELGQLALAGLPAASLLLKSDLASAAARAAKPNSKWAGVQVGMNMPYNLGTGNYTSGDEILARTLQLGISSIELRAQPVELFLGSPEAVAAAAAQAARGQGGGGRGRAAAPAAAPAGRAADTPAPAAGGGRAAGAQAAAAAPQGGARGGGRAAGSTPEQIAAAEDLRKWRLSVPMSKVKEFRKKYEDAGVTIEIVKYDGILQFTDDILDYSFELAKALGARAISCELPPAQVADSKRLGQFADKHKMLIGFHGHAQMTPALWEQAFSYAKYNGANVDLGHFVAGNNTSPIPFMKQHHDRITHVHVKDRKLNEGPNVPFGQGDTPVKEALQLIRDSKWPLQATIEFEYPVPTGSDRMAEMAKCVEYCKQCLLG